MNTEFSVRGRQYIILYNAIGMGGGLCHTFLKWLDQEDLEVFSLGKRKEGSYGSYGYYGDHDNKKKTL